MRRGIGGTVIAVCLGCGDDGGAGLTGETNETNETTETTPLTDSTNDATSTLTSGPGSTSTADTGSTESSNTTTAESSSGTGVSGVVILQNDQWEDGEQLLFQMGFVQDECWASTYVPRPNQYPLTVDAAQLLVGGDNRGTGDFDVSIWSVDADNKPDEMLESGRVQISGINADLDVVLFEPLFERPTFESGNFAIALCFAAHDGFPAIGRDNDGTIADDLNWIFAGGEWVQSSSLSLAGDWIMRASVVVE